MAKLLGYDMNSFVENNDPMIRILHRNLAYDSVTGSLTWRRSRGRRCIAGTEAGCIRPHRRTLYKTIRICGELLYAHRIAWALYYGVWPDDEIDHEDGNGLNNAIDNLRDATTAINSRNCRMYNNNKSGATGVSWVISRKKWIAQIAKVHLGYFATIEEASTAYETAKALHGFHSTHGAVK